MFDLLWSTYLCFRFAFAVLFCHYVFIVFIFLKAVYLPIVCFHDCKNKSKICECAILAYIFIPF